MKNSWHSQKVLRNCETVHFLADYSHNMSESDKKWACEYCTYENFPSALKCTMCRAPRPFVKEDIYHIRVNNKKSEDKISPTRDPVATSVDGVSKCVQCTFINSNVCLVCGFPSVSAHSLHEHIKPLRISPNSDMAQTLQLSKNCSPPASVTNLENSRRSSQSKWICQVGNLLNLTNNLLILLIVRHV